MTTGSERHLFDDINEPSLIKQDFAFDIVTLWIDAEPIDEIVMSSQTPELWEPEPVDWIDDMNTALLAIKFPSTLIQ